MAIGVGDTALKVVQRLKSVLGTLIRDRPFLAWPLWLPRALRRGREETWVRFCNRDERLLTNPSGRGLDCDWKWTSDLTLGRVIPRATGLILREALSAWPIEPCEANPAYEDRTPEVTFIVGHRGVERLPLLFATLESLRAQRGCTTEIVVVEQSTQPLLPGRLAPGVRLIHQDPLDPEMPYSRSWAFNRGAQEARGAVLVLHDNDVLAPSSYAAEIAALSRRGFEAMRLQRFVFYLGEEETERVVRTAAAGKWALESLNPASVRQNCQGATMAVSRAAYFRIGGHDEDFVGWGGEDNEFFDRCRLLRFHPWGYLPFVHLWHGPQPEKGRDTGLLERFRGKMAVPADERARRLARSLSSGE